MQKLKPCPFCGGTDIMIKDEGNWSYIWCGDCLSAFWQLEACSVEDNVEAWNKRKTGATAIGVVNGSLIIQKQTAKEIHNIKHVETLKL